MRQYFESLEESILSPWAIKSKQSKGRAFVERACPYRTNFQRDRDRIIHSKAFRRLKHKTQVFISNESDHYRSRLTHTVEVAQVSRHLARLLRLNEDLAESIALAHDLGHTPYGHSGERAMHRLMRHSGGFEHNFQSRRIVEVLEKKYPDFSGLNLSFEVRDGLIKHRTPWDFPSADSRCPSLEAQCVNIADEIAYNNHDLDDGLRSGLLDESALEQHVVLWKEAKTRVSAAHSALSSTEMRTLINSALISSQVENVYRTTKQGIDRLDADQRPPEAAKNGIVRFDREMKDKNRELRSYLYSQFYSHYRIYRMNKKGQLVIEGLFEAFANDPGLLPGHVQQKIEGDTPKERVICDYIAGMTDVFALKEFEAIYPGNKSLFF